ncbi:hypothetical protein WMY93_020324 [Mugilogobius chulae]|uniref:Uncharacterized protein n=1 Tax=Mugilogobius chulae TaxID=88201 RepID=A0AAW0NTJ4_9GOBI
MVYTAALLFGHGLLPEENVMEKKLFYPDKMQQAARCSRRGSVESYEDTDNNSLRKLLGTFEATLEDEERLLQDSVTQQLELCLVQAKTSALHCRALMLPRHMTSRVSRDVVRASADEPCGLRGASVRVFAETKDGPVFLGGFRPDPDVTATFELSVWFRVDPERGWTPLRHLFEPGKTVKLRAEYKLVKRKLYSSASPVVHDFN